MGPVGEGWMGACGTSLGGQSCALSSSKTPDEKLYPGNGAKCPEWRTSPLSE